MPHWEFENKYPIMLSVSRSNIFIDYVEHARIDYKRFIRRMLGKYFRPFFCFAAGYSCRKVTLYVSRRIKEKVIYSLSPPHRVSPVLSAWRWSSLSVRIYREQNTVDSQEPRRKFSSPLSPPPSFFVRGFNL